MKISDASRDLLPRARPRLSSPGKKIYGSRVHRSIMVHLPSTEIPLCYRAATDWGYQSSVGTGVWIFFPWFWTEKNMRTLRCLEKIVSFAIWHGLAHATALNKIIIIISINNILTIICIIILIILNNNNNSKTHHRLMSHLCALTARKIHFYSFVSH